MDKIIIAIGGGDIRYMAEGKILPYENDEIDRKIVESCSKKNPQFLFIGTASKEDNDYFLTMKKVYENLGCKVEELKILNRNITFNEIENIIFSSDIIYVGGGDTKFMLDEWRKHKVDQLLIKAYDRGTIMCGISAGSYCWFNTNYNLIGGLDIIKAINIAHYNLKTSSQKQQFYNNIKQVKLPGIALDDYVAIEFKNNISRVIHTRKGYKAYLIKFINEDFIETEISNDIDYQQLF